MRTLLVLALLAALPACAPKAAPPAAAAAQGPEIVLPCDWPAGASFTYEHGRKRTDTRNPTLAEVATSTPLTVTVERPGNPAAITYATGTPTMTGPEEAVAAAAAFLATPTPPMRLVLTDGSVTDLENHTELVDAMAPALAASLPADDPRAKQAFDQTMALMREAGGKQLLLRDPSRFFAMHCVAMHVGQVLEAPVEFPNPLGGAPIPGTSRVELVAHDPAAGTVTFATRDAIDPAASGAIVDAAIARFAPGELSAEQRAQIVAQLPPIDSIITGRMVYAVADGFPVSIALHQEVGAEGHPLRRTEDWTWTRTAR